ncbi:MAG TPA: N-acetyltransferase [Oryzihumus sp.]|nr:N-acetyltransferase [Oryzihumus sp.]
MTAAPPAIRLQDATDPAERASVRRVVEAAFGAQEGPQVAALVDALQASDAFADRLSFVAEQDGAVVGHVMLTRGWVDAPQRLVEVLVLSPLSVLPEHQRGGVGRALVAHAVAAAGDAGSPAVFLEGSPAYYSRLGFEPGSAHGFTRPSVRIPEPAFQVVTLPAREPWMTGALVYPDPFWVHDCVGLR